MPFPFGRILVLFAVPDELAPFKRRLRPGEPSRLPRRAAGAGLLGGRELLLATTGVGRRCAESTALALIPEWAPDLVLMCGVAGALSPTLRVGDIIAADGVRTPDGLRHPEPLPWPEAAGAVRGALLSQDRVLITPAEKRAAAAECPECLAVEMETAGVIQAAQSHCVPWAAVRAVSDTAEEGLPLDFNRLRSADGDLPVSRVAAAALTHPGAIPGLVRLGRGTRQAAHRLADYLVRSLAAGS